VSVSGFPENTSMAVVVEAFEKQGKILVSIFLMMMEAGEVDSPHGLLNSNVYPEDYVYSSHNSCQ